MPVSLTDRTANMERFRNLGEKYQLKIVEDSAQAVGAKYYDKKQEIWAMWDVLVCIHLKSSCSYVMVVC